MIHWPWVAKCLHLDLTSQRFKNLREISQAREVSHLTPCCCNCNDTVAFLLNRSLCKNNSLKKSHTNQRHNHYLTQWYKYVSQFLPYKLLLKYNSLCCFPAKLISSIQLIFQTGKVWWLRVRLRKKLTHQISRSRKLFYRTKTRLKFPIQTL